MPKFIQKYQCLFCNTLFGTVENAAIHENNCSYNPEAMKCGTCKYLIYDYYDNWICNFEPEDGSSTYEYYDNSLTCPYHELETKETK